MDEIEIIIEPIVTNVVIEVQEQAPGGGVGNGQDGASAYEIAVANGFVGTEAEWLISLQGEDGADGAQGPQGEQGPQGIQGTPGNDGADGSDGASAYEIAVANGFVGTEVEWLASLQGEDGADGAQGPQGIQGLPGNDGADGSDGASAYEIAVANGFVGTEAEWLTSLQGEDGAQGPQGEQGPQGIQGTPGNDGADGSDGASAYEIAVANGFVGTEAEWLTSLQGEDGADGAQGPQGIQGEQGPQGIQGVPGNDGADGADGTSSTTVGEPSGSAVILNMVSISQANYDAAVIADEIVDTTLYIITDA